MKFKIAQTIALTAGAMLIGCSVGNADPVVPAKSFKFDKDGTWRVPQDIPQGEYLFSSNKTSGYSYWAACRDRECKSRVDAEYIFGDTKTKVLLSKETKYLMLFSMKIEGR